MNIKEFGILICAFAIFVFAWGNNDYKKTKSGLTYKIISDGKGEHIKPGQFIKVYMGDKMGDSVLRSNFGQMPAYGPYDTSREAYYNFIDFLKEMRVGDSAIYNLEVDTLVKRGVMQYNETFKKGAIITGTVRLLKAFANEGEMAADQKAEEEKEKKGEIARIESFLKEKNINNTQKTKNGVFVAIEKAGTGPMADSGQEVSLTYTGTLFNGTKFDSNIDSATGKMTHPLTFVVGARGMIAGLDEGVRVMRQGSKGKLFIPASLGYGPQAKGDKIPAFSNLIFDIEVMEVKPAAVAPSSPIMPPAQVPLPKH